MRIILRIIVAFPQLSDAKKLKSLLQQNGYDDITACNSAAQVISLANESDGGIVLCGYRLSDMYYREIYGYLPKEFRMLLIASPAKIEECSLGSIMSLAMPLHTHELISTMETMLLELYQPRKKYYALCQRNERKGKKRL